MQNVLLVNPVLPRSFWSFQEIMRVTGKQALMPPLGLLTVAALFPESWTARLADCNVSPLTEDAWAFADVVMISAMLVQRDGMLACIAEAKRRGKIVVAGGPYVTSAPEEALAAGCDFVVAGEGEYAIAALVEAVEQGLPGGIIASERKTDMKAVPTPRFDLIDPNDYDAMPVQTSRGCPFACEFCDVINLFGRTPRYKPVDRVLAELEAIHALGYRGSIFVTDDNFIGNPQRAEELLRQLIPWNKERAEPFWFTTQASINLGERPDLIDLMTEANFGYVFIGIESPDMDVLNGTHKHQNTRRPLLDSIRAINANGLTVIGSFILGFDKELKGEGARIEAFAEAANLSLVMVNTLQAVPKTKLWERLKAEGRLLEGDVGDMATGLMNFVPQRPVKDILTEQITAWEHLYDPARSMARSLRCILEMRPTRKALHGEEKRDAPKKITSTADKRDAARQARLLFKLAWRFGVRSRHRLQFWRQLWIVARRNPSRWRRYLTLLALSDDILSFTSVIRKRAAPALREKRGQPPH